MHARKAAARCRCLPTHVATFSRRGAQYNSRPAARTPRRYLANLHSGEPEVLPPRGFLFRRSYEAYRLSMFQPRHFPPALLPSHFLPIFSNFLARIARIWWPHTFGSHLNSRYFSTIYMLRNSERSFHKETFNLSYIMNCCTHDKIKYREQKYVT